MPLRFLRPAVETLEDRVVPSVLQVGTNQPYPTIGSALQAANPGDTIRVHPGTYQEAVDITKNNITLQGVNQSAIIQSPSDLSSNDFAIVWVNGATGVTISHLSVEGPYNGGFSTVNGNLLGLHAGIFVGNGGSATISHDHVTDIRDNPPSTTVDDGFAILVGSRPDVLDTTGSAVIADNTVDNYQRGGIDVANTGSSALIRNNTVTGLSLPLANQYLEQVGLAVEAGGTAVIVGNTISQNLQTNANGSNFGFGLYIANPGAGFSVVANTVTDDNYGIYVFSAQGALLAGNSVSGSTVDGIDLVSSSGVTLVGNAASHNAGNGIALLGSTGNLVLFNSTRHNSAEGLFADAGSTGNSFLLNATRDNGLYDAEDLSFGPASAGTANTWVGNRGKTDNQGGGLLH